MHFRFNIAVKSLKRNMHAQEKGVETSIMDDSDCQDVFGFSKRLALKIGFDEAFGGTEEFRTVREAERICFLQTLSGLDFMVPS